MEWMCTDRACGQAMHLPPLQDRRLLTCKAALLKLPQKPERQLPEPNLPGSGLLAQLSLGMICFYNVRLDVWE